MCAKNISNIRRNYGAQSLGEESVLDDPLAQFQLWFDDVLDNETYDPTAMVLSTVDAKGHPDSRVVLLKEIDEGRFVFYTNYQSAKAIQLQANPYAALNFYWPERVRQVRIRGTVEKISPEKSDRYFASRPIKSQYSAVISPQSQEISSRALLEQALYDLQEEEEPIIKRPDFWGGYQLIPQELEFWQGRDERLHDRIYYFQEQGKWKYRRLAP